MPVIGELCTNFTADMTGLKDGVGQYGTEIDNAKKKTDGLDAASINLSAQLNILELGLKYGRMALTYFTDSTVDAYGSVEKFQWMTGATVKEGAKWHELMGNMGLDINDISFAFKMLSNNVEGALSGSNSRAFDAFQTLGVSLKDSNGQLKDSNTIMLETITALQHTSAGTERNALANDTLGRSYMNLSKLLDSSTDATILFDKTTTNMTDNGMNKYKEYQKTLNEFNSSIENLKVGIGEGLLPVFKTFTDFLGKEMVPALNNMGRGIEQTAYNARHAWAYLTGEETYDQFKSAVQGNTGFLQAMETSSELSTLQIIGNKVRNGTKLSSDELALLEKYKDKIPLTYEAATRQPETAPKPDISSDEQLAASKYFSGSPSSSAGLGSNTGSSGGSSSGQSGGGNDVGSDDWLEANEANLTRWLTEAAITPKTYQDWKKQLETFRKEEIIANVQTLADLQKNMDDKTRSVKEHADDEMAYMDLMARTEITVAKMKDKALIDQWHDLVKQLHDSPATGVININTFVASLSSGGNPPLPSTNPYGQAATTSWSAGGNKWDGIGVSTQGSAMYQFMYSCFSSGLSYQNALSRWASGNISDYGPSGGVTQLGYAAGGDVEKDKPIIVGESGKEIFVPKSAGTIIPNTQIILDTAQSITPNTQINTPQMAALPSGGVSTQTVNITVELDGQIIAQKIASPLVDEIRVRTGVRF